MRKFIFPLLILLSFNAHAMEINQVRLLSLSMRSRVISLGSHTAIFAKATTDFKSSDEVRVVLKADVEGRALSQQNISPVSWVFSLKPDAIGTQTVQVHVYIEDKLESDSLRAEIETLSLDIESLNKRISVEEDPSEKLILEASRDSKSADKIRAEADLEGLKLYVGFEEISYEVVE